MALSRRAVFLDRDGTLVEPRHYPSQPDDLRLYAGVGAALAHLRRLGFLLVVVSNQSGVARGYFSERDLEVMNQHLRRQLRREGVDLDGIYCCVHHPEGAVAELAIRCDCRKPEPGMLLRAAHDLGIDLTRSWLVGDIRDDIEAGRRAGCRTVLVDLGTEAPDSSPLRNPDFTCRDTATALELIAAVEQRRASDATELAAQGGLGVAPA